MKTQSLFLAVIVLMSSFAIAQTSSAPSNPNLKSEMDQLSTLFKDIYANMNNAAMNSQSAADAAQMITIFNEVLNEVPASISAMPAAQQAAALTSFKGLIQDEITQATALKAAFVAGDNATAQTIYLKMNSDKSEGHNQFK